MCWKDFYFINFDAMKKYILRRDGVFRLLSLMAVAVSVFLPDLYMKMGLLLLGILGLAVVSYAKEQKIGLIIFSVAFITTLIVCYLILNGYRIGGMR